LLFIFLSFFSLLSFRRAETSSAQEDTTTTEPLFSFPAPADARCLSVFTCP